MAKKLKSENGRTREASNEEIKEKSSENEGNE